MKFKLPILVILAIIFALTIMIQPSYAETPTTTRVIIGISTVRFELFRNVLTRYGTVISDIPEIGAVVLEINIGRLNDIKKLWFVKYVERDYEVSITQEVRWNMEMIYVPNVWYTYDDYVGDA
ncbi:MAG: hypothetical protein QXO78_04350, partial [Desulfurococcaceae archaeon]